MQGCGRLLHPPRGLRRDADQGPQRAAHRHHESAPAGAVRVLTPSRPCRWGGWAGTAEHRASSLLIRGGQREAEPSHWSVCCERPCWTLALNCVWGRNVGTSLPRRTW
eukprot:3953098-Prymnesium_polylepis.2